MPTMYTYAIQASDDGGQTWTTDPNYAATEEDEYDRGPERVARTVLNNYLLDVANAAGLPFGSAPAAPTRVVIWNGEQQGSMSTAAAVINA